MNPIDNMEDSKSFKSKIKLTCKTPEDGNTKDAEIIVPLKYLSNFWRTLEMPLINCEVILILTWFRDFVIANSNGAGKKLFVPIVSLSTQHNARLLQELKSGFKRTINWNEYESNTRTFAKSRYLNHLINSCFQDVNRHFLLSFKNENDRTSHSTYNLPNVEIKDDNVMIDGKNLFDQPVNSLNKTYKTIRKYATGQGDDYTTGCLLDYSYFNDNYKMIAD